MVGYDFDGVLALQPPKSPISWGKMKGPQRKEWKQFLLKHYAEAPPLFTPRETEFAVITARKNDPEIQSISAAWLRATFPAAVTHLHLFEGSRSIESVVAFKAAKIAALGLTDFTEDNPAVVRGLYAAVGGHCRIWKYHYKKGALLFEPGL